MWLREVSGPHGRPIYLRYLIKNPPNTGLPRQNVKNWDVRTLGTVNLADLTPDGAKLLFVLPQSTVPLAFVAFVVPYEWIVSVWWNGDRVAIQIAAFIGVANGSAQARPFNW